MTKRPLILVTTFLLIFTVCFSIQSTLAETEPAAGKTAKETSNVSKISRIRFHKHDKHTRIVLDTNSKISYGLASQNIPPALILELTDTDISDLKKKSLNVNGERVMSIVATSPTRGNVKITIQTKLIRDYRVFTLTKPFRIVIDIKEKTLTGYREPRTISHPRVTEVDVQEEIEDESYEDYTDIQSDATERSGPFVKINGYIGNESSYRISDTREMTKSRNILKLKLRGELTDKVSYRIGGRSYYDAVFDMTGNYPDNVEDDQETETELRETYLDISRGNMDLRLGKQTIVWGEAVGLFFADVVNAKDLREFVLPDFNYIRKPQWSGLLEYTGDLSHLEFIWIPKLEFNDYGVSGSEFPVALAVPEGVSPSVASAVEPASNFKNSEYGTRLSYFMSGWDLSLFYLYTWDKEGANFRVINSATSYTFTPTYKRLRISGMTVAKEIKDIIFKAEVIYTSGKYFALLDSADADGVTKADYIDYLIGMDYTFFDDLEANFQFMQRVIPDHDGRFFRQDHIRNTGSVRLKTGLFDNAVEPELMVISSLEELDIMIRPKVGFTFKDNWRLYVGADIFAGESDGVFGQYKDKDRIYTEIGYSF